MCQPIDVSGIPDDHPRLDRREVIVSVAVCGRDGTKEQEFDMLASQSLAELRDAFWFVQDYSFDGPCRTKSALFFIDGIFYIDDRDPSALDYSANIIEWLKGREGVLRSNEPRSMSVRLCDIDRIPFGKRCLYQHQGNIEHNVFFTGARLISPADCLFPEAYPILMFIRTYFKKLCSGCKRGAVSVWVVLDALRIANQPIYLCQICLQHFLKDENGEIIQPEDYRVFPYLHDVPWYQKSIALHE